MFPGMTQTLFIVPHFPDGETEAERESNETILLRSQKRTESRPSNPVLKGLGDTPTAPFLRGESGVSERAGRELLR